MNEQKVEITLERYEELVKKEAIYDKLMESKRISLYVYTEVEAQEGSK